MEEGRVYTHGTLSAVRQRSDRAGTLQRLLSIRNTGTPVCAGEKRTARASASLRVMVARAPPRAPTLASHGLNVRCKKTYRATQRTNHVHVHVSYVIR
jgi:hypothetical protein